MSKIGLQRLGSKKGGVFLMWAALPKTQRCVKTLCYCPCDDTPTAATVLVVVTTGGVQYCFDNFFFCSILHLAVHGRSDTPPVVSSHWEYRHMSEATCQILELASYLLAHTYKRHSNFQVILLLLSLPIKVVQCLTAPLSFSSSLHIKFHLFRP